MSSRRVLIRILALLQSKTLIETKKSHIWQVKSPHPREVAIQGKKKMLMPGGQPRGAGEGWAQVELTDALYLYI